jgi:glutamate/tyrosine decarboxylase-like PLP-dependent enzyme
MKYLGEDGYRNIARIVMETKEKITAGIESIEDLQLLVDSKLGIVTFGSREFDVFAVADKMDRCNWYTARIKKPPGMHLVITPANSMAADEFLIDLKEAAYLVKEKRFTHKNHQIDY